MAFLSFFLYSFISSFLPFFILSDCCWVVLVLVVIMLVFVVAIVFLKPDLVVGYVMRMGRDPEPIYNYGLIYCYRVILLDLGVRLS